MIFAFMTVTRVRWDDGSDELIEEHGWVDDGWSLRELHDSRNYVNPVFSHGVDSECLEDEVMEALSLLPGGFEDNGDGTFYAVDPEFPLHDNLEGWRYNYAIHFTRKYFGDNGWTEKPWHPVKDGGISISDS